jgi:hypothetical protein
LKAARLPRQLTSPAWGTREGTAVAAIERTPTDTNTLWAATGTGRVFISDNSDEPNPSLIVWHRIDQTAANSPGRFISSIYPDPQNPRVLYAATHGRSAWKLRLPGAGDDRD